MGKGGTITKRVDIIDIYDPRLTGRAAEKGTLFRFIPSAGNPILLIKADDGFTTNWISVGGGGGGSVTGDPETLAYYNSVTGDLTDNTNARFKPILNSMALLATPGTINQGGESSLVLEKGDGTETVNLTGMASLIRGRFIVNSVVSAISFASSAIGYANNGTITANTGAGAEARGEALDSGTLLSSGAGASALGSANQSGQISALSSGSIAAGATNAGGQINAGSPGTFGSFAFGGTNAGATLNSIETGTLAHGACTDAGSVISASNGGAHAHGVAGGGGRIDAGGFAAHASGFALTNLISASGFASAVFGTCNSGDHVSSGSASFSIGDANTASGDLSLTTGLGNLNASYCCFVLGRYGSTPSASTNSWVNTDPVFVTGNGSGVGSEANSFEISKDGRIKTTAAQVHAACRSVNSDTTLSDRTDRSIFVNTTTATGNVNITFPAGVDGLEYFVKDSGDNATVNNILFLPSGADTIEASADITNSRGTRHFQFFGGVWYVMNLP